MYGFGDPWDNFDLVPSTQNRPVGLDWVEAFRCPKTSIYIW